jgi:hypothetical protein
MVGERPVATNLKETPMAEDRSARRTSFGTLALLLCLAVGPASCSSSGAATPGDAGDGNPSASDDAELVCPPVGMQVDTYSPGMKKAGDSGHFTFEIMDATPSPPSDPALNTWTIRVLDAQGSPVPNAVVTLPETAVALGWSFTRNPWMPIMKHGSPINNVITANSDGTTKAVIDFSMTGYWQTLVVATVGTTTDSAKFSFCLP